MPPRMGDIFSDVGDAFSDAADAVGDVVTSVVDNISDAGKVLGSILHAIAPIVAMWPGIGTAVSVALSAASAVALGTPVDEALIDTASNAIPGGLPRIGFNGAVAVTRDLVEGRNAFGSVVDACRNAAYAAGGPQAGAAFDTAIDVARGNNVSDSAIAAARGALEGQGPAALSAFDAGVAVAKGEDADEVLFAAARDYIAASGGPLALAAFDSGLALAHGKALQEAGFAALQAFVQGNDAAERGVSFLRKMVKASQEGRDLGAVLVQDLAQEVRPFLGAVNPAAVLGPVLDAIVADNSALQWSAQALADAWGYAEPVVRAAQVLAMNGGRQGALFAQLVPPSIKDRAESDSVKMAASVVQRAHVTPVGESSGTSILGKFAQSASAGIAKPVAPPAVIVSKAPVASVAPAATPLAMAAAASSAPKTSALGDVALGGTIAAAALAVLWWRAS